MKTVSIVLFGVMFFYPVTTTVFANEMKGSLVEKVVAQAVDPASEKPAMDNSVKDSGLGDMKMAPSANAKIMATQEGSEISGSVDFVQTGEGVQVVASLSSVTPPGKHGIHIHENGSCDENGKAAGGHFNPAGVNHGLLSRDGHSNAHIGDMGNIEIDEAGNGTLVIFLPGLSLSEGNNNIVEKAVILHAKEDDFGQPTGNAGGRIGCGLIVLSK